MRTIDLIGGTLVSVSLWTVGVDVSQVATPTPIPAPTSHHIVDPIKPAMDRFYGFVDWGHCSDIVLTPDRVTKRTKAKAAKGLEECWKRFNPEL